MVSGRVCRFCLIGFDNIPISLFIKKFRNFFYRFFKLYSMHIYSVYIPTKVKKYTVLRSVHIFKKTREQFEIRLYKHNLDISKNIFRKIYKRKLIFNPYYDILYFLKYFINRKFILKYFKNLIDNFMVKMHF
jgi:ribosomal protein S10